MTKTRQTPHFCAQSDRLDKEEKDKSSCDARKPLWYSSLFFQFIICFTTCLDLPR